MKKRIQSKNKYYMKADGYWNHRSPIKLIINPILRKLQWFTQRPYVIASETKFVDGKPEFIAYKFCRVFHAK
jgi:hypothetical protein